MGTNNIQFHVHNHGVDTLCSERNVKVNGVVVRRGSCLNDDGISVYCPPITPEPVECTGCVGCGGPDCAEKTNTPESLEEWWVGQAEAEAPEIARKAREYGSNSLAAMGGMLDSLSGFNADLPNATALELGCFAYAYGKVQRALDAYQRGEIPSEDTWRDIHVYSLMVLRIRDTGGWPGGVVE